MSDLFQEVFFFGTLFSLVLVAHYLVQPRRAIATYMMALLYVCAAFAFFYAYVLYRRLDFDWAVLNHLYLPFFYFIGPSIYFAFLAAVNEDFRIDPIKMLAFAPGLALLAFLPSGGYLLPELFESTLNDYFDGRPAGWTELLLIGGLAINLVYFLALLSDVSIAFNLESLRTEEAARILLMMLLSAGTLSGISIYAFMVRDEPFFFWIVFTGALLLPFNFISSTRRPDLFLDLEVALTRARERKREAAGYKNSRLEGIDLKVLQKNLDRLMREEKVFLEDDMTLQKLAAEAGVKSYQLTEFLNTRLKMNFSRYVNHFRIEEAVQILDETPEANILSVAYQVGFNSKANFNLAFKSIKGMSPRQFLATRSS